MRVGAFILVLGSLLLRPALADDRQEILGYKLTMPVADQLIAALPEVTRIVLSLPDWRERLTKTAHATLEQRTVEAEKSPQTVAILKKHGLTPRQYVAGIVALRMALTAAGLPAGTKLPPSLVASTENLAFAKAHLKELRPKMDAADRAGVPQSK